jgi:hypothetical protein
MAAKQRQQAGVDARAGDKAARFVGELGETARAGLDAQMMDCLSHDG